MKIVEKYRTEWLGMIHEAVDADDDGYPYLLYARDRFETRENAVWFITEMKARDTNGEYRKLFYDPTDVNDHPWIVYSWTKAA